jgi:polysaccharide export outer membrane protein
MKPIVGVILLLTLIACAPTHVVINRTSVAQLQKQGHLTQVQDYKIQVGDELDIKLYYNPELNDRVPVRPDGRISLQLVGEIMVFDMTPAELTKLLMEKYSSELRKPDVTVIVRSFNAQKVFVDGEVYKPGLLTLTGPLTLLQSISMAGGVKDTARMNDLILIRRGIDNKPMATTVDMTKILDGTGMAQDIQLAPYDIVYVPKSAIAHVNIWVDQYIRKNIPISTGFGFSYQFGGAN